MKIFGYELGKRWYFDANLEIEYLQRHLEELDEMKAEMIRMAPNSDKIKNAVAKIDSMIERHQKNLAKKRQHLRDFAEVIRMLPDREREFAVLHFIKGKTLEEIAEEMYYSYVTVNKIKNDAVSKITAYLGAKKI